MDSRELSIRTAVAGGRVPSLDDFKWVLDTLDTVRRHQREDALVTAVSIEYGSWFADSLLHDLWNSVKESSNMQGIES